MKSSWLAGVAAIAGLAGIASAVPVITVGNHELLPNTAGQTIQIHVSGGDDVDGLNFNAQIGNGGPEVGGTDGPNLTADIINGTIFAGNNTGQQDPGSVPQVAARTTTTGQGTVDAQGVLATLTIDTTGFFTGTFDLLLSNTLNEDTT